jgi:hypothetical protein
MNKEEKGETVYSDLNGYHPDDRSGISRLCPTSTGANYPGPQTSPTGDFNCSGACPGYITGSRAPACHPGAQAHPNGSLTDC